MKITTALLVLATALPFAASHPTPPSPQHLVRTPSICSSASTLAFFIHDLYTFPTDGDVYMAEAQAMTVDDDLQCPTEHGTLVDGRPASDACKKNQEIKYGLQALKYTSPDDKRGRLDGLNALCAQLDAMIGCVAK